MLFQRHGKIRELVPAAADLLAVRREGCRQLPLGHVRTFISANEFEPSLPEPHGPVKRCISGSSEIFSSHPEAAAGIQERCGPTLHHVRYRSIA